MSKAVQMSIKMESELHHQFMAVAAHEHRPAAQILRDLMRAYISHQENPNAETIAAIEAIERGDTKTYANSSDLFKELGIDEHT